MKTIKCGNSKCEQKDFEKEMDLITFDQREEGWSHYSYEQELAYYAKICAGDLEAVFGDDMTQNRKINGYLSKNALLNAKYMAVISTALTTRHCIAAGLDPMEAFAGSDFFIHKLDSCDTPESVEELRKDMLYYFTSQMGKQDKNSRKTDYSKPVELGMDYVYNHLHEKIRIEEIAEVVGLNADYFDTLFKKETGITLVQYITKKKVEEAKRLLQYSSYSVTQIGYLLSYSSTSYFIKIFKEQTGVTPSKYKKGAVKKILY